MKMYYHFLLSLLRHKWYVFLSGRKAHVPLWRLIIHDWSKFAPSEFVAYAQNFFASDEFRNQENLRAFEEYSVAEAAPFGHYVDERFALAWLHHENHNPHHWGYWIARSGKYRKPLPMPETYVREMVADWHGAGREYQKSWDISEWIGINGPRMEPFMHNETVFLVHKIMGELGYSVTYGNNWVFHRQPDSFKVKQN